MAKRGTLARTVCYNTLGFVVPSDDKLNKQEGASICEAALGQLFGIISKDLEMSELLDLEFDIVWQCHKGSRQHARL